MHHFFWDGPPEHGPSLVLFLLLLAVGAAAITAIVLASRNRGTSNLAAKDPPGAAPRSEASRILDERYARGEIDDEEYQRRRGVLNSTT
jgi:putative membrane protein